MPRIVNVNFDAENEVVNERESAKKTLKAEVSRMKDFLYLNIAGPRIRGGFEWQSCLIVRNL
jgi:hypothetical protein